MGRVAEVDGYGFHRLEGLLSYRLFPGQPFGVTLFTVAPAAEDLQVSSTVLLVVKAHPCRGVHRVVAVPLADDAVKSEFLGGPAACAAVAQLDEEAYPGMACPYFVTAGHGVKSSPPRDRVQT